MGATKLISALIVLILIAWIWTPSFSNNDPLGVYNEPSNKKLVITGSSTIAPLALEIAKAYEKMHPGSGIRIDVQSGGSSRGIQDTRQGLADIGMVSRNLTSNEKDLFTYPIAKDGIGVIVHSKNPIKQLSHHQLKSIFTGKIINWKDLGGHDHAITVVNKAEGRSTLELFLKYLNLKNTQIKAHVVIGDNEQGIKTVAGSVDAIAYVSIGTAVYDIKLGVPIKFLDVAGIEATLANVGTGAFPMSRTLNLVTKGPSNGLGRLFIEFAQSEQAGKIVRTQYFIPITP